LFLQSHTSIEERERERERRERERERETDREPERGGGAGGGAGGRERQGRREREKEERENLQRDSGLLELGGAPLIEAPARECGRNAKCFFVLAPWLNVASLRCGLCLWRTKIGPHDGFLFKWCALNVCFPKLIQRTTFERIGRGGGIPRLAQPSASVFCTSFVLPPTACTNRIEGKQSARRGEKENSRQANGWKGALEPGDTGCGESVPGLTHFFDRA
jgi:hypothetical protein